MTWLQFVAALFLGCTHARTTWPQTPVRRHNATTYVVCLDCGREFLYDLDAMHIAGPRPAPAALATGVPIRSES